MPSDKPLIAEIELFLKRTGMSATQFGASAAGDTKLVKTLRAGRQPRAKTELSLRDYMDNYGG